MRKINKILTTSILATVLIGAGAVKVSQDSTKIAAYNSGQAKSVGGASDIIYDDEWYGQRASINPEQLDQQIIEQKGASSEWVEYKTNQVKYEKNNDSTNSSSDTYNLPDTAYVAMNYSLVNSPDLVSFGDVTTKQYYEIGLVFRREKHGASSDKYKTFLSYLASNGILNDSDDAWAEDNSITFMHKWYGVEDYDEFDVVDSGFPDFYTTETSMATQDLEHRAVYGHIQDFETNVSYEDWHSSFDNDETTLFGATKYNPGAHVILRFPIADSPVDSDYNDSFGVTPSAYQHPTQHYNIYGDAVSNKDILGISQVQLTTRASAGTNSDSYSMFFGQPSSQFDGKHPEAAKDWDTKMDHAMELSFPEPEFTITPLGYNDRNQFEVDVLYDHKAIPTNYDIVSEITYTMMGPATKDSTEGQPKVIWDEITITDQKVTREHRKTIDSPETVVDTIWTYGDPIPDELSQWIDGDKDNGGNVDIDENPVGGAEEMFPIKDDDGNPTGEGYAYDGDMEIGAEESAHSVIKYDGLYYGDDAGDKGKEYTFSNTITLAPTDLGRDNAYLLAVPDGDSVTKTYGPWSYIIEPGSATPILEHFEVTRPESLDAIDPLGTMEISYSGDSKSEDEDTGVGLKPSYLNYLQVIATETDEAGNVIDKNVETALTDPFKVTNFDEKTGAFSGTVTTSDEAILTANSHYRISLRAFYGNEAMPEDAIADHDSGKTLVADYTLPGEYLNVATTSFGDLDIVLTDNTVSYDDTKNEATLTFNYSQAIPTNPDTGAPLGELSEFSDPKIAKVEVVNHLGEENETVIDTVDFSGVTLTDVPTEATITVGADKLLPNKTHDLSVRVTTVAGRTHVSTDVNEDTDFITPATGAFVPVVGILAPVNTVDVSGGVTTDFEFTLKQQTGDGIDSVETSESLITNISLVLTDAEGNAIINEPTIAVPTEDSSKIMITDSEHLFDTVTEYDYSIVVSYGATETVTKEGKVSFELSGFSELESEDVVMTDISSTMTSLYFETEINDVVIEPGYDSYYINKVEVVDAENKAVDADIIWYDVDGNPIDAPVDTEEGIEFSGKFSAQLTNIKAGTDLSTYQLHVNTNSINESEDDLTPFETDYYFNLFELAKLGGLTDETGNFLNSPDMSKEFMDVTPVEVSGFSEDSLTVGEDTVTFRVNLNDKLDVIKKEEIVVTDNFGVEYSMEKGNLEATHTMDSREDGMKTYEFTLTGLKGGKDYSDLTMTYVISENLGTEEAPLLSSTSYTVELTDVAFRTLDSHSFPWWIIILILLILSIVGILLALFFIIVRVTATTDKSAGKAKFTINKPFDSEFARNIKGRTLVASQGGKEVKPAFTTAADSKGKLEVTLTGISNTAPITKLNFVKTKASEKDIKVFGSVKTSLEGPKPKTPVKGQGSARKIDVK